MNPVKCPPDAFCPAGSAEPAYCMEAFLYKAGDSCQLTPLMVILLAVFSAGKCQSSLSSGKIKTPPSAASCYANSGLWMAYFMFLETCISTKGLFGCFQCKL